MDRLQAMRVFERVVDEGGFAAAARALDMSAPVVTRLVAELETHLGTRLLQRSTRRLSLTEAGQSYLNRVRGILQDVDEAEAAASSDTRELTGVLSLHAQSVLASYAIAPLLAEFRRRYPKIQFFIDVEAFSGEARYEDYDLTLIVTDERFDADVVARKMLTAEAILVASPEYLARCGTPQTPEELAGHDFLWMRLGDERPHVVRMWRPEEPQHVVEARPRTALVTNHIDTLLRATLDGVGISPSTLNVVAPYLARGELVRVLPPWIHGHRVVYAVLPSRKFIPQRTRVFLDYLIEEALRRQSALPQGLG
jgi:DNA-binding transcriptional LysR family regulator